MVFDTDFSAPFLLPRTTIPLDILLTRLCTVAQFSMEATSPHLTHTSPLPIRDSDFTLTLIFFAVVLKTPYSPLHHRNVVWTETITKRAFALDWTEDPSTGKFSHQKVYMSGVAT